jgi:glycosyltransferase involved in cell wall biosynthesis
LIKKSSDHSSRRLKVLLLLQHWDPEAQNLFGPMTKTFGYLENHLEMTVITKSGNCNPHYAKNVEKICIAKSNNFQFLFFYLLRSIKVIRQQKIDIVYGHSLGYVALLMIIIKFIFREKIKTVFWLCNDGSDQAKLIDGFVSVNKVIFILLHRYVDRMLSGCSVVGLDQAHYYKSKRNDLYSYISNSFDPQNYYPPQEINESHSITVVYVSRKSFRKGYDKFLNVVEHFIGHDNISFISVGGGKTFEAEEKSLISRSKNFHVYGSLSQSDLGRVLRRCQIMLVPARFNGFARAYIEAMASGVCPITRDTQCTSQFIVNGENGIIVDTNQDAIEAIHCLMKDSKRLRDLRMAAVNSSNKFKVSDIALDYLNSFENIVWKNDNN